MAELEEEVQPTLRFHYPTLQQYGEAHGRAPIAADNHTKCQATHTVMRLARYQVICRYWSQYWKPFLTSPTTQIMR